MFAAHGDVGTTVCFTQNDIDLDRCRFGISVEQFCTMTDDSLVFLIFSRKESGNVSQCNDRNVVSVTVADKAGSLITGIAVQNAGHIIWLVGYDTYGDSFQTTKSNNDVFGKFFLYFYE